MAGGSGGGGGGLSGKVRSIISPCAHGQVGGSIGSVLTMGASVRSAVSSGVAVRGGVGIDWALPGAEDDEGCWEAARASGV